MNESKLSPQSVSIVVQGPVAGTPDLPVQERVTQRVLASIRRCFPGAEIVLSTWEGTNLDGLDYDIAQLNSDPGGFSVEGPDGSQFPNNMNRMLFSTRRGLEAATRPYAIKCRTDCEFANDRILNGFGRFDFGGETYRFVKNRIVGCTHYSRDPRIPYPGLGHLAHHPSDIIQLGWTEDLRLLWSAPLALTPESRWQELEAPDTKRMYRWFRYLPEQYVWLHFLRQHTTIECDHLSHVNPAIVEETDRYIAGNFVLQTPHQLGIVPLKPGLLKRFLPETCYTYRQWLQTYGRISRRGSFSMLVPDLPKYRNWVRLLAWEGRNRFRSLRSRIERRLGMAQG